MTKIKHSASNVEHDHMDRSHQPALPQPLPGSLRVSTWLLFARKQAHIWKLQEGLKFTTDTGQTKSDLVRYL